MTFSTEIALFAQACGIFVSGAARERMQSFGILTGHSINDEPYIEHNDDGCDEASE